MRLIVEGKSDEVFVRQYCRFLNPDMDEKISIANGKDNLIHHKDIKKYKTLIIFDADDDYGRSKENIVSQLKTMEVDIDEYPIFLFPNNQESGNLETLIEKIALHPKILQCFQGYCDCIKSQMSGDENFRLPAKKSKVFAYMEVFGFKNGINEKDFKFDTCCDFESAYLKPLRDFIESNS